MHLVDLLTQTYDVVLMNPPYGAMCPGCKEYARRHYPRTHSDASTERSSDAAAHCSAAE